LLVAFETLILYDITVTSFDVIVVIASYPFVDVAVVSAIWLLIKVPLRRDHSNLVAF
jgi:hypothetical protein